jgi:hypothetical protein
MSKFGSIEHRQKTAIAVKRTRMAQRAHKQRKQNLQRLYNLDERMHFPEQFRQGEFRVYHCI